MAGNYGSCSRADRRAAGAALVDGQPSDDDRVDRAAIRWGYLGLTVYAILAAVIEGFATVAAHDRDASRAVVWFILAAIDFGLAARAAFWVVRFRRTLRAVRPGHPPGPSGSPRRG